MLFRLVYLADAGEAETKLKFGEAAHRRALRHALVKRYRLFRLFEVFGDPAEHHENIGAFRVEPTRRLKVERNDVFRALAVERAADRKENGGRTLHGVAYLLLLRLPFLDTLPQRLERSVVVDEAFADGDRIQRLLLVAFARFESRQRLDGPHESVRRSAAAFSVKNGVVEPGARRRLVAGRKRNRPGMIVPEDPEPFRAIQILDLRQRFLRSPPGRTWPGESSELISRSRSFGPS